MKDLKRKFTPQFVQMKNTNGTYVPVTKRAQTIAEYLEDVHWKNNVDAGIPQQTEIIGPNNADEMPFTLEELSQSLKSCKNNKQPGPDNLQMELLKWLDRDNRKTLLNLINIWWCNKSAPHDLFRARVVPIFKKGETDNAANYRPISLLSSIYKVYMIMLRQRMQRAVECNLCKTQYGFRPQKSTSHAIYIIRRIQDYAEMKGAKLSMAMLDWEKAFDKIQHDKLILTLKRLGFSQHYCDVIQDCYSKPTFFVKDAFGMSDYKKQSSGIRQGCPLSPYLFVLVMSCIDHDISASTSSRVSNARLPGLDFDMVYYADDTIIFSTDNRSLNELLRLTETISSKYGLKLNKDKCVAIQMNNEGQVHFDNGEPLPKKYEATYLGNEINRDVNIKHEVLNKMQEVRKIWFKMAPYWKASNANQKWQLIIFDAVIRSKLLYGLETVHLTNALLKKVDAFQLRCLRRILKLAPTFVDRSNTNMAVIQKASSIAYPDDHDSRSIKLFSFHYNEKRGKLLGHIIRADSSDPLRQISLEPHSANRIQYGKKRCGRPRQNWLHYTKSYVYENKFNFHSYEEGPQDDSRIYNAALQRSF